MTPRRFTVHATFGTHWRVYDGLTPTDDVFPSAELAQAYADRRNRRP